VNSLRSAISTPSSGDTMNRNWCLSSRQRDANSPAIHRIEFGAVGARRRPIHRHPVALDVAQVHGDRTRTGALSVDDPGLHSRDIDELQAGLAGESCKRLRERLCRNAGGERRGFKGLG
jgi:hypothetical protein